LGLAFLTISIMVLFGESQSAQLLAFLFPFLAVAYLTRKGFEDSRLSWMLPLTGYTATFLIGAGLSASNRDIRTMVEIVGVGVCMIFTALGGYYTVEAFRHAGERPSSLWRRHAASGIACNLLLVWLIAVSAHASYVAKTPPESAEFTGRDRPMHHEVMGQMPVWIDTDPACGVGKTADVDDCWALLAATRSPELGIRGISTVFGNQDGTRALAFAQDILPRLTDGSEISDHLPNIYEGSTRKGQSTWPPTPASRALASALNHEPLTIIALGPLTNPATVIRNHPELAAKIDRIVLVGGKRPGQLFHPSHHWWFHFGDFNVSHDPEATAIVLYSGVPITLVPFDLATKLLVTESDLERLSAGDDSAKWLSDVSQPWFAFWNTMLEKPGFHPFDVLAVAYTAMPDHFRCVPTRARIGFNLFLEPFGMGRDLEVAQDIQGPIVTNCVDLNPKLKDILLTRLMGSSRSSFRMATAM